MMRPRTTVVTLVFALALVLSWTTKSRAGTCTPGVGARLTQLSASVADCKYVDYGAGADTNTGDDESHAWKHMPGMRSWTTSLTSPTDACTGNCAAFTPSAGSAIILKGGSVWPYTSFPLVFCSGYPPTGGTCSKRWEGSSSTATFGCQGPNCMVVGVDPSWNAGTVNAITLTRDLGGCTGTPTVSITGGAGSGATAHAVMVPSSATASSNGAAQLVGGIAYIVVDSPGTGYTSNPTVTITGSGCRTQTAVADITRAIFDYGLEKNYVWTQTGNAFAHGPMWTGLGSFGIWDSIEARNLLTDPTAVSAVGVWQDTMTSSTSSNIYAHNYKEAACVKGQSEGEDGINTNGGTFHEVRDSFTSNGEQLTIFSGSGCGTGWLSVGTAFVYGSGGMNMSSGWYHNNRVSLSRWQFRGGTNKASEPLVLDSNEAWFNVYSCCGGHVNDIYMTTGGGGTVYEIGNFTHDDVGGSSNQIPQSNGGQWYVFDNLRVNLGGGSPAWGIDLNFGATNAPAFMRFLNNTVVNGGGGQGLFANDIGGPYGSQLAVTVQNNHCIGCTNGFYATATTNGAHWENQAGETTSAAITGAQILQTPSAASAQGYTLSNLYAPTTASDDTVTFAGANLTSTCGTSFPLDRLCLDRVGAARPATGAWQAGAYQYCDGGCLPVDGGISDSGLGDGGGADANANGDGGSSTNPPGAGCGCRTATHTPGGFGFAWLASIAAVVVARRRRRLAAPLAWLIALGCFATARSSFATSYYVDYASGLDSNNGTTKTTPWQHAPGMQTCTGACSTTTVNPGDAIVLKGGTTWPNASFEWRLPSGALGNPVYIGVDKTWYAGASFTRPTLTANSMVISNHYNTMFSVGANTTVDDFEVTGFYKQLGSCTGSQYGECGIFDCGQNTGQTFENLYIHGWTHDGTSATTNPSGIIFVFSMGGAGTQIAHDNVIVGTDFPGDHSANAFFNGPSTAYNNYIKQVSSAFIVSYPSDYHDNHIEDIGPAYCNTPVAQYAGVCTHENGFEDNGDTGLVFYNNVITNVNYGLALWIAPNPGYTAALWNNVIYGVHDNQVIDMARPVYAASHCSTGKDALGYCNNSGTFILENNTVECGDDTTQYDFCQNNVGASHATSVVYRNNHFITQTTAKGCKAGLTNCTFDSSNVVQTLASASGQGYSSSQTFPFSPTSSTSLTVGAGADLSSAAVGSFVTLASDTTLACLLGTGGQTSCPTKASVARIANRWDTGAYQYCDGGCGAGGDGGGALDAASDAAIGEGGELPPDGGSKPSGGEGGCSCHASTGHGAKTGWLLAVGVLLVVTRRSRGRAVVLVARACVGIGVMFATSGCGSSSGQPDGGAPDATPDSVAPDAAVLPLPQGADCVHSTCYYVSTSGNDANDGTSRATAWAHAPLMQGATGVAAAHALKQTDALVFKGGDVWTVANGSLPWPVRGQPKVATPNGSPFLYPGLYFGIDPSWNSGQLLSVRLVDPGVGCTAITVTLSGGGGAGATASARLEPTGAGGNGPQTGMVAHVNVTNAGSGYTSNPAVSFGGTTCAKLPVAVADVYSPIIDAGGTVWNMTNTGKAAGVVVAFSCDYGTFDHFELRNFEVDSTLPDTANMVLLGTSGTGVTVSNDYFHNWYGTSPAGQNPGTKDVTQALTNVQVTANVLTVTGPNTFVPGEHIQFTGVKNATFLNKAQIVVTAATPTQWSGSHTAADYGPVADTGTAVLLAFNFFKAEQMNVGNADQGGALIGSFSDNSEATIITDGCDWSKTAPPPCGQGSGVEGNNFAIDNVAHDARDGIRGLRSPVDYHGNALFNLLDDCCTQHCDTIYGGASGVIHDNVIHDIQGGCAAFYIETSTGGNTPAGYTTTLYDNVCYNIGSSTPCIGFTSEFMATGATSLSAPVNMNAYNNTFFGFQAACINAGQWFGSSASLPMGFNLENNHCISDQAGSHWYYGGANTSSVWNGMPNGDGAAAQAAIDAANTVMTPTDATTQGYMTGTVKNAAGFTMAITVNQLAPSSSTDQTTTAAGKNFTSLCTGPLAPLCSANGVPDSTLPTKTRPTTGNWQSGAYQY